MEEIKSRASVWKVISFVEAWEGSTSVDMYHQRPNVSFVPFVCFLFIQRRRTLAKEIRSSLHRTSFPATISMHQNEHAHILLVPPSNPLHLSPSALAIVHRVP